MMHWQGFDWHKGDGVPTSIASVLVVENDRVIASLIAKHLDMSRFSSTIVNDSVAMDALLAVREFDLIVLNLTLPGEDGLSIC